ncbi:MAG: hypothetical protein WA623_12100, partial [Candidatus Sulfotelmatobacter sp.]
MVTIDTAIVGLRARDPLKGVPQLMGENLLATVPFFQQLFVRPRWLISFLLDRGVPNRMLKNDSQSTGRRVSSGSMRGDDQRQDGMFSYISPDKRVPQ